MRRLVTNCREMPRNMPLGTKPQHRRARSADRKPATHGLGDPLQPGPGDLADGQVAGVPGVGALAGRLGGVDAEAVSGSRRRRRSPARPRAPSYRCRRRSRAPARRPGMVSRIRRTSPVGLGDSKTVAEQLLELRDRGVGRADLLGQPDGLDLLAPAPVGAASPSGRRRPARPLAPDPAADQVVGARVDPRPPTSATPPAYRRRRPARSRPRPANGSVRTAPVSGSPQTGKCSVRAVTGLNFLLVLRSGRCR